MCSPILALAGAGAVVQGVSAFSTAQTNAANQRNQAAASERDAQLTAEQGSFEAARTAERGAQAIGSQVAGFASNGISPSTGTPLDVVTRTGADIGLDIAASRYGANAAIANDKYKARVYRSNADAFAASAPLAFVSPILSAGATYLKGGFG